MQLNNPCLKSVGRGYVTTPYKIKSAALKIASIIFLSLTIFTVHAQTTDIDVKQLNLDKRIAINGYDVVAYFTVGKGVDGSSKISYTLNGVTYYFASDANRQLFIKQPAKYLPQYGGWCAYAMATKGEKVEIDPQTFKIVNGKLLLFYNKFFNNTLTTWNKNETALLPKADANWSKIVKK